MQYSYTESNPLVILQLYQAGRPELPVIPRVLGAKVLPAKAKIRPPTASTYPLSLPRKLSAFSSPESSQSMSQESPSPLSLCFPSSSRPQTLDLASAWAQQLSMRSKALPLYPGSTTKFVVKQEKRVNGYGSRSSSFSSSSLDSSGLTPLPSEVTMASIGTSTPIVVTSNVSSLGGSAFPCDHCSRIFTNALEFQKHQEEVSNSRPFACELWYHL